jgi:tetracycline repressor-like protein
MTETTTRHERKKQRTRALIRETAWELFAAHGYDATTIKAIADAAGRLESRLAARPAGEPALETLRQWMIQTIGDISSSRAEQARSYWRAGAACQAHRRERPAAWPGAGLLRHR